MNGAAPKPLEVAAGLVFRDGKLLITRRPAGGHLGGLWEFPGGKREPRETFIQCLHRELREELGIQVRVGVLLDDITHAYPGRAIRLKFFQCRWVRHEPQPISCDALAWIEKSELSNYEFPAADARLLEMLKQNRSLWDDEG